VFLNGASIYWSSKKQTSCKTSTIGSEFVLEIQADDDEHYSGSARRLSLETINQYRPTQLHLDLREEEVQCHYLSLCL
jgi:hypothetical protein